MLSVRLRLLAGLCYDQPIMSENSSSGVEFRENTRAPLQARATIQIDAFSEPLTGFTANVSKGGMFVEMKDLPPVGSIIKFQVEIGEPTQTVSGTAEVVWIRTQARPKQPVGVGLQFRFIESNGAPALSAAVHKVLAELGPEPEPAQPVKRKPPPPGAKPTSKRDEKSSKKKQTADDSKQILGMPAEKAKMILLLVLMAFLLLVFLLRFDG
jgi:Tfp pilus assembly protein PilZ